MVGDLADGSTFSTSWKWSVRVELDEHPARASSVPSSSVINWFMHEAWGVDDALLATISV